MSVRMITATYTISGIKGEMELMSLSGTIAGWMILHPDTMLDAYEDHADESEARA